MAESNLILRDVNDASQWTPRSKQGELQPDRIIKVDKIYQWANSGGILFQNTFVYHGFGGKCSHNYSIWETFFQGDLSNFNSSGHQTLSETFLKYHFVQKNKAKLHKRVNYKQKTC